MGEITLVSNTCSETSGMKSNCVTNEEEFAEDLEKGGKFNFAEKSP